MDGTMTDHTGATGERCPTPSVQQQEHRMSTVRDIMESADDIVSLRGRPRSPTVPGLALAAPYLRTSEARSNPPEQALQFTRTLTNSRGARFFTPQCGHANTRGCSAGSRNPARGVRPS